MWASEEIGFALVAHGIVEATRRPVKKLFEKLRTRGRPFRTLLTFNPDYNTLIIVPGRPPAMGFGSLAGSQQVAQADLDARDNIMRALRAVRWPCAMVKKLIVPCPMLLQPTDELDQFTRAEKMQNLVLICSHKRNSVTGEVLDLLNSTGQIKCRFQAIPGKVEQWVLYFDDAMMESPSHKQEIEYPQPNGRLVDYALLAKVRNPWNQKATVMIMAGIRGIGIWGAAEFMLRNTEDIVQKTGGRDFEWILRVTYNDRSIEKVEGTTHYASY